MFIADSAPAMSKEGPADGAALARALKAVVRITVENIIVIVRLGIGLIIEI
jgi:hypothetical protein